MKKTAAILIIFLLVLPLAACMKKPVKPTVNKAADETSYAEEGGPQTSVSGRFASGKGFNLVTSAKSLYGNVMKAFGKIGKNGKPLELRKNDLINVLIAAGAVLVILLVIAQNRPKKYASPKGKYQGKTSAPF